MVHSFGPVVVGWYDGRLDWTSISFPRGRLVIDRRSTHHVAFGERQGWVVVHYCGPITWHWRPELRP